MSLFEQIGGSADEKGRQKAKVYGVVVGIVTNNVDPDKLGRVKVRFPWLSDEDESHWARIATLMAGPGRGAFFLPEVDDEVLVAFENGNVDVPYVVGALWNGVDTPIQTNEDEKNNIRQIITRSGHSLTFDDNSDDGTEKITLQTQLGHTVEMDDTDGTGSISVTTAAGHVLTLSDADEKAELTTTAGHTLTMDDAGEAVSIATAGGHTLSLDDSGKSVGLVDSGGNEVVLDTGGNAIGIKAGGEVKVTGASSVVVDAPDIKLGGSASLTLVNDTFLQIFNSHMHPTPMGPSGPPVVPGIKNVHSTMITKGA